MDKKAIKILLSTFAKAQKKDPANWFKNYSNYISDEDFDYAKRHCTMFDPMVISHDEIFVRIKKAVETIKKEDVVNAFLYSLSTRRIEYRSFLSSYCIGKVIPIHPLTKCEQPNSIYCSICGLHTGYYSNELNESVDLNASNYSKYKFGASMEFAHQVLFDLEQFHHFPKVTPTEKDVEILNEIKKIIKSSAPDDRIPVLRKRISTAFQKSNNYERESLLEIFGVIGILHDETHLGFADRYIPFTERESRPIHYDDVLYPANWWQGKHGVDEEKWDFWFGKNR